MGSDRRVVVFASLLALTTVALGVPTVSAQTAWRQSHTAAQPLLVFYTPPLTGGTTYWIQVGGPLVNEDLVSPRDAIATLRTSMSAAGSNLGGSDGCTHLGQTRGSCFAVTIPASYTTPTTFPLLVRAKTTTSGGTASIRMQVGGNGGGELPRILADDGLLDNRRLQPELRRRNQSDRYVDHELSFRDA